MKKSATIARQIGELQTRRETVINAQREAEGKVRTARKSYAAGALDLSAVTAAQGDVSALAGTLGDVDAELERLRGELRGAEESERRAADAGRVSELTAERARLAEGHTARLRALDEHLGAEVAQIIAERTRDAALAAEIRERGGDPPPALGDLRWSDYGLRHGRHIAEAVGARAAEDRRARVKANLTRATA